MLFYYRKLVPTEIKKFWYSSQVKGVFSRKQVRVLFETNALKSFSLRRSHSISFPEETLIYYVIKNEKSL